MKPRNKLPSIVTVMERTFGHQFGDLSTWKPGKVLLKAIFGLPKNKGEQAMCAKHTGRETLPEKPFSEVWVAAGRKSGKSRLAALVGVYMACYRDYTPYLAPGEEAVVMIIAQNRERAQQIYGYAEGFLQASPHLEHLVVSRKQELIRFANRTAIQVVTCNFRAARGITACAVLADEIAFWLDPEGSSNPAEEVLRALRPSLLTIPNSLLLCISSPFSDEGVLWEAVEKYWGNEESDVLVWRASTPEMNLTISQAKVDAAFARDPLAARREYYGEFLSSRDDYVSDTALRKIFGEYQWMEYDWRQRYYCYVDMAGGAGSDSAALCIGHRDRDTDTVFVDYLYEWRPPFDPQKVVREIRNACMMYSIRTVHGDSFAGGTMPSIFADHQLIYNSKVPTTSQNYERLIPLIMSETVLWPDNDDLRRQVRSLVVWRSRGGRTTIGHPVGRHDDLIAAVAGLCVLLESQRGHICIVEQVVF
jgi:hypothetical protein